jgi:hypothetical protein
MQSGEKLISTTGAIRQGEYSWWLSEDLRSYARVTVSSTQVPDVSLNVQYGGVFPKYARVTSILVRVRYKLDDNLGRVPRGTWEQVFSVGPERPNVSIRIASPTAMNHHVTLSILSFTVERIHWALNF